MSKVAPVRGKKGVVVGERRVDPPPFLSVLTCGFVISERNLLCLVVESGGKWGSVDGVGR